jgi:hypothetical protein
MNYSPEKFFIGAGLLAVGLTFNGFGTSSLPPADAHENELIRFAAAANPINTSDVMLERFEPSEVIEPVTRTYEKNEEMSPESLKDLLIEVGFEGEALRQAWGTVMKESTGRPMAHNKNSNTGDNSYGLFQINMIGSLGPARLDKYALESNEDLFNPYINATIAFQMSNGGKDWSAWHGITDRTKEWMKEFPN